MSRPDMILKELDRMKDGLSEEIYTECVNRVNWYGWSGDTFDLIDYITKWHDVELPF